MSAEQLLSGPVLMAASGLALFLAVLWLARVRNAAPGSGRWWLASNLPGLALAGALLARARFLQQEFPLEAPSPVWGVWTLGSLILLGSLLCLLPWRLRVWTALAVNLGASLVMMTDLAYYRVFHDFPSLCMLSEVRHLLQVSDGVGAVVHARDWLLLGDLMLWVALVRSRGPEPWNDRPARALPGAVALLMVALGALFIHSDPEEEVSWLNGRMFNPAYMERLGALAYHQYDLWMEVEHLVLDRPSGDRATLQALVEESRRSIAADTPYRGCQRGRNLLLVQFEALQSFVVDLEVAGQEVTPCLNRLRASCLYAAMYDQTGPGGSSDCDFVINNSIHPLGRGPVCFTYPGNRYRGLPALLHEQGYHTLYAMPYDSAFWNSRVMTTGYGYDRHLYEDDLEPVEADEEVGWSMSDQAFFHRMLPRVANCPQPFAAHLVTCMGHHPYQELAPWDEELWLPEELEGTMMGDYLQVCRYRDHALAQLVEGLQASGRWEDTVVVIYGDHQNRLEDDQFRLLPQVEQDWALRSRMPLLVHCPGDEPRGPLPEPVGQLDVAPTLLHLLGVTDSRPVFLGRNALADHPREVVSRRGFAVDSEWFVTSALHSNYQALTGRHLADRREAASGWQGLADRMGREFGSSELLLREDLVPELSQPR